MTTMSTQEALLKFTQTKGQFLSVTIHRKVKVKKNQPEFYKTSTMIVRGGVEYDNIQAVQEDRASGELPEQNAGLNGCKWIAYPYLLESEKTGKIQLRLTTVPNHKAKVVFTDADGNEVDQNVVKLAALSSEFPKKVEGETQDVRVFNVNFESVVSIFGCEVE